MFSVYSWECESETFNEKHVPRREMLLSSFKFDLSSCSWSLERFTASRHKFARSQEVPLTEVIILAGNILCHLAIAHGRKLLEKDQSTRSVKAKNQEHVNQIIYIYIYIMSSRLMELLNCWILRYYILSCHRFLRHKFYRTRPLPNGFFCSLLLESHVMQKFSSGDSTAFIISDTRARERKCSNPN